VKASWLDGTQRAGGAIGVCRLVWKRTPDSARPRAPNIISLLTCGTWAGEIASFQVASSSFAPHTIAAGLAWVSSGIDTLACPGALACRHGDEQRNREPDR